jgi:SAM-dependent methyltransferase
MAGARQRNLSEIARNIELGQDGLWAARTVSDVSYPDSGNEFCFAVEESSFWFRHRNNCILELMKSLPPPGAFFDVGGGNGYVARAIQNAGLETILIEPGLSGAKNALKRGVLNVVRATLEDAAFLPEVLPAVGLFDVVEHIQEDRAFLTGISRLMTPGGRVYLTVPAFRWLWSGEDEEAGHWRRYTLQSVSKTLTHAGFEVEFATYFFGFLPLPILLFRALPHRIGFARTKGADGAARSDHELNSSLANRILQKLMRRELLNIAAGRPCSVGGSCLVVARKPQRGAA